MWLALLKYFNFLIIIFEEAFVNFDNLAKSLRVVPLTLQSLEKIMCFTTKGACSIKEFSSLSIQCKAKGEKLTNHPKVAFVVVAVTVVIFESVLLHVLAQTKYSCTCAHTLSQKNCKNTHAQACI